MRDAYFAPERVKREGGIDPLFRGAVRQTSQEIDLKVCKCKEILSRRSDFCPFCGLSGTGEANNRHILTACCAEFSLELTLNITLWGPI